MAGFDLHFDFAGEQQVNRKLAIVVDRAADLSPAFERIHSGREWAHSPGATPTRAESFLDMERRQFSSKGTRGPSGAWRPLSPRYAEWKARAYPGRPILVRRGTLKGSLTNPAHPEHVKLIAPQRAEFGTDVPYASFHQRGTKRMPRRPPIELTEFDKRAWARVIHRFVVEEWGAERVPLGAS